MWISACRIATQQEIDRDWKKPVLITTQDGTEVTNKYQLLYGVTDQWTKKDQSVEGVQRYPTEGCTWFSTSAARTEWMIRNKLLFSIVDLQNMDKEQYPGSSIDHTLGLSVEKLKAEAKKRIER